MQFKQPNMEKHGSKNPIINLFGYTWKYSFGAKRKVVLFIALSVIANAIYLMQPIVAGKIFNVIQFSGADSDLLGKIFQYLGLFVLITVGFWIFHGTSRVIENSNAFLVRKNYKKEMFDKVMDLPVAWHKDHHSGDTIDKINKASEALFTFSEQIFIVVQGVLRMAGSVGILFFFDWKASAVALAVSVVAISVIFGFDKKLIKGYEIVFRRENKLAAAIHDYISNVITVITLRLKKRVSQEIETRSMRPFSVFRRNAVLNEWKWFSASFLISLMTVLVLGMNAYTSYKLKGVIVAGTLFVLYQYLQNVGGTFYNFAWQYGEMVRLNTAMEAAEIINDAFGAVEKKKKFDLPKKWKTLLIKNLSFVYEDAESEQKKRESHIENISLKIEQGSRIALIGESGSGKSTILSLLRGLYAPQKATLYCEGAKLDGGLNHIYDHVTLAPQEPEIFNSTIEDNITMGLFATKKEIQEAVEIARFDSVLKRLLKGLKTNVMEKGVNLSGGEKQRLALARAILASRDSEFLFMDEPTSSVDSENEINIYKNTFERLKEKTIISSVHRLHLLRYFDYIYYFKDGKILTEGTFRMLLEDEKFKALWENYKNDKIERRQE
jgi:ATP-binding cassette, subfamily B, bacterial